jgi:hypothetical protein
MSRFVRPDTETLTLANGDRVVVKKALTAGEQRAAFARMLLRQPDGTYVVDADGRLVRDPTLYGINIITAFLLDWTLTDDDGAVVQIRGLSVDELARTVDSLDPPSFNEIRDAIDDHYGVVVAARQEKKPLMAGGKGSVATYTSVS